MNPLRRAELALRALAAIFAIVGIGAVLWRPSVTAGDVAPAVFDSTTRTGLRLASVDAKAGQTIVDGNIFSAARAAPAVRYSPFESDSGSVAATIPDSSMVGTGEVPPDDGVPQLLGTVVGPRGGSALMRLDPATPGAQLYHEGDRGGSYRVVKINEQSVVLSGPRGQLVLRLRRTGGQAQ